MTRAYISFSLSRSVRARAFVVERVVCRLVFDSPLLTASTAVRDNVDEWLVVEPQNERESELTLTPRCTGWRRVRSPPMDANRTAKHFVLALCIAGCAVVVLIVCAQSTNILSRHRHTQWHARLCALGRSRLGVVTVGRDPARTVRLVVSLSLFQLSRQGHEHATRSTAVKFVVGVVNDHFLVPSDVLVCDNEIDDRFAAAIDQLPLAAFYKKSLDF